MNKKILLISSSLILTFYFGLVWAHLLPKPSFLPNEIEPIITVLGSIIALYTFVSEKPNPKTDKIDLIEPISKKIEGNEHEKLLGNHLTIIPTRLGDSAIGITHQTKELLEQLPESKTFISIDGIGGQGKTTFIQVFCEKHRYSFDNLAYITVRADYSDWSESAEKNSRVINDEEFMDAFLDSGLDISFGINLDFSISKRKRFAKIIREMGKLDGLNLLVIDNMPNVDVQLINDLSSLKKNWKIIITSREDFGAERTHFRLKQLHIEKAVELFNKYFDPTNKKKISKVSLQPILKIIGHHPMGIELLAKHCYKNNWNISLLEKKIQEHGLNFIDGVNIELGKTEKHQSIVKHLIENFLMDLTIDGKTLMRYFSLMPSFDSNIAPSLLTNKILAVYFQEMYRENYFYSKLDELVRLGWIKKDIIVKNKKTPDIIYFACHFVIQEAARIQLKPDSSNCQNLLKGLIKVFSADRENNIHENESIPFISIADYVFNRLMKDKDIKKCIPTDEYLVTLGGQLGQVYKFKEEFEKALKYHKQSFLIAENIFSETNIEYISSLNLLAGTQRDMGQIQEGLQNYKETLRLTESFHPNNKIELSHIYNEISIIYSYLEQFEETVNYLLKSIEIKKEVKGETYIQIGVNYSNLGMAYNNLKNYEESLKYYILADEILTKDFDDYPDLAFTYIGYAQTLFDLNRLEEAKEVADKAINICFKKYPQGHSLINTCYALLNNINSSLLN